MKSWGTPTSSAARSKLSGQRRAPGGAGNFGLVGQGLRRDAQILHGHLARHDGVQGDLIERLAALAADLARFGFRPGDSRQW